MAAGFLFFVGWKSAAAVTIAWGGLNAFRSEINLEIAARGVAASDAPDSEWPANMGESGDEAGARDTTTMSVDPNDPAVRLIRSWHYRFGFEPTPAVFLLLGTVVAFGQGSVWSVFGLVVAVVSLSFMSIRYWRWRGRPWRRIYNRGMLLWAVVSGMLDGVGGATTSVKLRTLATLLKTENPSLDPVKTLGFLEAQQGNYLANLLGRDQSQSLGAVSGIEQVKSALASMNSIISGSMSDEEQLIIRVIEETCGWQEAAECAYSLIRDI